MNEIEEIKETLVIKEELKLITEKFENLIQKIQLPMKKWL